ncbi:hypothetical protein LF887_03445 [Chryseobacterium sp. MEBOG06]|uniref:hypothetical protein n=1 Tax=Chryseobacterium sp. MEBOG06 TaxID=2879938 RepID=UPI001F32592D|nr:hypothetical protein [Chryseobacterium sp. MEBOG06]UKB84712.1 hypothetical protein LF887_03445 [Chryseobacterium sp. MEBOG06]
MKNEKKAKKKLSLEKLQIAKIDNLHKVFGGGPGHVVQNIDGCANGDDGSSLDDGLGGPKIPITK